MSSHLSQQLEGFWGLDGESWVCGGLWPGRRSPGHGSVPTAEEGSSLVDNSLTLLSSCSYFNHGHRVAKFC